MLHNLLLRTEHLSTADKSIFDMNIRIYQGNIVGLAGLNGSGKSAFSHVLLGQDGTYIGNIYLDEELIKLRSVRAARAAGIYGLREQIDLFQDFSVWENISIFSSKVQRGMIPRETARSLAKNILSDMGQQIDVDKTLSLLSPFQKRLVQLAQAVAADAKLIIIDSVTNDFSVNDFDCFFKVLDRISQSGVSVLLISQRPEQLFRTAYIIAMREGTYVGTIFKENFSREYLQNIVAGYTLHRVITKSHVLQDEEVLRIDHLETSTLHNFSLSLKRGEILGVMDLGILDSTELFQIAMGKRSARAGTLTIAGHELPQVTPRLLLENRIALIPNLQLMNSIFPEMSIADNLSFLILKRASSLGIIKNRLLDYFLQHQLAEMSISETDILSPAESLSLSKEDALALCISRAESIHPVAVICLETTKELDAVAKMHIWERYKALSRKGTAIIVISTDMTELNTICDRTIVLENGVSIHASQKSVISTL